MGQPVTVREKPSTNPAVLRFEINRSLTGMGHERYRSIDDIIRDRPVDVVARRLFEAGGVEAVHVNSSVITVNLRGGGTGQGLAEVIENLFRFYTENGTATEMVEESTEEDAEAVDTEPTQPEPPGTDAGEPEAQAEAPEAVSDEALAEVTEEVNDEGEEVADEGEEEVADEGEDVSDQGEEEVADEGGQATTDEGADDGEAVTDDGDETA